MRYYFFVLILITISESTLAQKVLRSKFHKAEAWFADTSFVTGIVEDINDSLLIINEDERNLNVAKRSYIELNQIKKIKIIKRRYARISEVASPAACFAAGAFIGSEGSIRKFERDKSNNIIIWSVAMGVAGYFSSLLHQEIKSVKIKPQKQNLSVQQLHEKINPYTYRYQIEQYKMKLISY